MQKYTIINQPVTLYSGIILLTAVQAAKRTACLNSLGEGYYLIHAPVEFKVGETIGYDGDINKDLMQVLKPLEPTGSKRKQP